MRAALVGVFTICLMVLTASIPQTAMGDEILEFDTMVGLPRPFTGTVNPVRGVNEGGLPWVIDKAEGELKTNGDIDVTVEGLVIDPDDPDVPENRRGINPAPAFRAIVSCISIDGTTGLPNIVNVSTAAFPADAGGNSVIEDNVSLPDPCIALIIFVTSPGGSWFAATGF